MEEVNKIQDNYEQLKKQSELTDKFIRIVNELKIDDKKLPKTDKGFDKIAKSLLEKVNKKIVKEEKKKK
jgi:hypothetical protein